MRRSSGAPNKLVVRGEEIPRTPLMPGDDPIRRYRVTINELERLVRSVKGRTIFLQVGQFAEAPSQEGVPPGSKRGKDASGSVVVSKRNALRFIDSAYGFVRTAGYVTYVSICQRCIFIG